jgi:uncharacterized protein with HEPN domain
MRDDRPYLEYIHESIERIESYIDLGEAPMTARDKLNDPRTEDAVLRRLETLSDAAGHLSDDLSPGTLRFRGGKCRTFVTSSRTGMST